MTTYPALALLEFDSIAVGIEAADAMVKRAAVAHVHVGTVQPGKLLVLVAGAVAEVEEALVAGRRAGAAALVGEVYLPGVHEDVVAAVEQGARWPPVLEALGIVETRTVAAAIRAADAGRKGAEVQLLEVRLADGLGGKGLVFFHGPVADVEAAVTFGAESTEAGELLYATVIPQLHADIATRLNAHTSSLPPTPSGS